MGKINIKNYTMLSTRRGIQKRKQTCFQKGDNDKRHVRANFDSTQVNRPCHRYNQEYFNVLTKKTDANELSIPGADGVDGSALILRPNTSESSNTQDENNSNSGRYDIEKGNILIEKSRFFKLLNNSIQEHMCLGLCDQLDLDLIEFEPWGLFSKAVLVCKSCDFRSEHTKLYEEIETPSPGRKAAAGNLRLQLVIQDLGIGQTDVQMLFAAVGLRAGSLSGMQKASCKAAKATEELAKADMIKWREHTKRILADRGVLSTNEFSAQFDVVYHGVFRASAKTPGQGAVQATATCLESDTSECKCIGMYHVNKMCPKGSRLKGKGKTVICGKPGDVNHEDCAANHPPGRSIRERTMAEHIAEDLAKSDVSVTVLTTDCDADGKSAFEKANIQSQKPLPEFTWYKDLTHTSKNMKLKILNHKFNNKSTPFGMKKNGTSWNPSELLDCRKALALDVPERVAITLKNMSAHYSGDVEKMYNRCERIAAYMLLCYKGDHHSCKSAPLAQLTGCNGIGSKSWFIRSSNLPSVGVSTLNLDKDDTEFLRSVIAMKLSKRNIIFYERRATTSRTESLNRAINKNLPKQKSWPVNSEARVCSAIGRHNNNFEDFTHMKFRSMKCPLSDDSPGYKVIRRYQQHKNNIAEYQKKESTIRRRRDLADEDRKDYFRERKLVTNSGEYHKFQFENALNVRNTALDSIELNDSEPQPSTSSEYSIQNALKANMLVKDVLKGAKKHNSSEMKRLRKKQKSKRRQKIALKSRNTAKTEARNTGSKTERKLRSEHSYGSLTKLSDK